MILLAFLFIFFSFLALIGFMSTPFGIYLIIFFLISRILILILMFNYSNSIQYWASLIAQLVKNPPAMWETWVQSLSREDPPEEGMATHSSILAWRIPMDRGARWATYIGLQRV